MITNVLKALVNNLFYETFDITFIGNEKSCQNIKSMFGHCFFLLFYVFKNNFLFLILKNLFRYLKWTKNKNSSQNSICNL